MTYDPTQYYKFDCGCTFRIKNASKVDAAGVPLLHIDEDEFNENCPKVWEMVGNGHTTGVFQLESNLGKNWAKRLSPVTIDHIAALTALLRPGTLNAKDEQGVSMTDHYCLRKNQKEPANPIHPAISKQLDNTYQVLVYQEQSIRIVSEVGGFSEEEADIMRRAMGKKDSKLMHDCEVKFIEGATKKGLPKDDAEFIFGLLKSGEKYSFCMGHSYGYGLTSFVTAYYKAHFPVKFFRAWFPFCRGSTFWQDKIKELVQDAIVLGVTIKCPDLRMRRRTFYTDGISIWFGLSAVKSVGGSSLDKVLNSIKTGEASYGPIAKWNWLKLLFGSLSKLNKSTCEALIHSGACDWVGVDRTKMHYEYNKFNSLVSKMKGMDDDVIAVYRDQKTLAEVLQDYLKTEAMQAGKMKPRAVKTAGVIDFLNNPVISLNDTLQSKHSHEQYYMAVALSVSNIDRAANKVITRNKQRQYTCRNLAMNEKVEKNGSLLALIKDVRVFNIKQGKNEGREMASLEISDNTGNAKLVMFADDWSRHKDKVRANSIYTFLIGQFNDAYTVADMQPFDVNQEDKIQRKLNDMISDVSIPEFA